jgi:hypothetical protein
MSPQSQGAAGPSPDGLHVCLSVTPLDDLVTSGTATLAPRRQTTRASRAGPLDGNSRRGEVAPLWTAIDDLEPRRTLRSRRL